MKNVLLLTMGVLTLALAPAAQAGDKYCYPEDTYDRDRDGYADLRGVAWNDERFKKSVDGINCPRGYATKSGDCNDADASVHPRNPEVAYNQVDDNCNGKVDEPSFRYSSAGWSNTTSSFRMILNTNHMGVRDTRGAILYADITFAALADLGAATTIRKQHVEKIQDAATGQWLPYLLVSGLSPGKVYRANVQFYRKNDNGTYAAVGPSTENYYTMTDSTNDKVHKRFQMVLRGLEQFNESELGRKGYRGTDRVDGTKYGADPNERWCSEFYVWVTKPWLVGIDGSTNTSDIRNYFDGYGWLLSASSIPDWASPGDYLALDSDQDGDINHSAMFLAYDRAAGRVRTLEGNKSNTVAIVARDADWNAAVPVLRKLGHIATSMF